MKALIVADVLDGDADATARLGALRRAFDRAALAYETFEMVRTGVPWRGALNLAAHLVLGLAAVWTGYAAAMKL